MFLFQPAAKAIGFYIRVGIAIFQGLGAGHFVLGGELRFLPRLVAPAMADVFFLAGGQCEGRNDTKDGYAVFPVHQGKNTKNLFRPRRWATCSAICFWLRLVLK